MAEPRRGAYWRASAYTQCCAFGSSAVAAVAGGGCHEKVPASGGTAQPQAYTIQSVVGVGTPPSYNPSQYPAYGLFETWTVSNVVPASYLDAIYAASHMGDNSSNCYYFVQQGFLNYPGCWTEIGWQCSEAAGCGPHYEIYTYQALRAAQAGDVSQGWRCWSPPNYPTGFPIAPGVSVSFAIESAGNGSWYDYLDWNGYWYLLDLTTLTTVVSTYPQEPNAVLEIDTNFGGTNQYFMQVQPAYANYLELDACLSGCWQYWIPSFPSYPWGCGYTPNDNYGLVFPPPYEYYYYWYGWGRAC